MKFKIITRLTMILLTLGSVSYKEIDAFNFGSFLKKAGGSLKKVAKSKVGQMALQAGAVGISAKYGDGAGDLFQGAAQSMHLAEEADANAEQSDQDAEEAAAAGDHEKASRHRTTAKMHRKIAADHRKHHEEQKHAYEKHSGRKFEEDYEEKVVPHLKHEAKKHYAEDFEDEDQDQDQDDDDQGYSDSEDDSDEEDEDDE